MDPQRYAAFRLPYGDGRFYIRKIRPTDKGANTVAGRTWVWFVRTSREGSRAMTFKTWEDAIRFTDRRGTGWSYPR